MSKPERVIRRTPATFFADITPSKPGVNPRHEYKWEPLKQQEKLPVRPGSEDWKDIPSWR